MKQISISNDSNIEGPSPKSYFEKEKKNIPSAKSEVKPENDIPWKSMYKALEERLNELEKDLTLSKLYY